jgi:hypothetical protein
MGSLPIRISECLDALYQYRASNNVSKGSDTVQAQLPKHFTTHTVDANDIYGSQIAQRFATEAAKRLSHQQFRQLL